MQNSNYPQNGSIVRLHASIFCMISDRLKVVEKACRENSIIMCQYIKLRLGELLAGRGGLLEQLVNAGTRIV